ncbi:MAG: TatD family hydrolase [Blastochloris sp.]|nr:TatD family hydrolase [Blastochloris sp.]
MGLHPCDAAEASPDAVSALAQLLPHPKVAAIGECGLDYHHRPARDESETEAEHQQRWKNLQDLQARLFREQLDLACRQQLNVIIHQRDSWQDTLSILRHYTGRLQAVFHCFGGSPEQAAELRALGHLISFTGILTFKNAALVRASAASATTGSFMIETDCPYLAPVPHRGQRCEPAQVALVGQALARERQTDPDALQNELWTTSHRFFRLEN